MVLIQEFWRRTKSFRGKCVHCRFNYCFSSATLMKISISTLIVQCCVKYQQQLILNFPHKLPVQTENHNLIKMQLINVIELEFKKSVKYASWVICCRGSEREGMWKITAEFYANCMERSAAVNRLQGHIKTGFISWFSLALTVI
jgi:hypothetical protein